VSLDSVKTCRKLSIIRNSSPENDNLTSEGFFLRITGLIVVFPYFSQVFRLVKLHFCTFCVLKTPVTVQCQNVGGVERTG